jgi:hypothetical protein
LNGRKDGSVEWFLITISLLSLVIVPSSYSLVFYTSIVAINPIKPSVVETVQVTGSIPNGMDGDQFGFFGAVFWNPTAVTYKITRVEFNASSAVNEVLNGVEEGAGSSYPTSGWTVDGEGKVVYLNTSMTVDPYSVQEYFVRIRGNGIAEAFQVSIRITANSSVYEQTYITEQTSGNSCLSVLLLGNGTVPEYVVSAVEGQETTFYVSLQEDADKVAIGSNGKLTISLPSEFANIQSLGGTGWGSAVIIGSQIEVNNTQTVRETAIIFGFKAEVPAYQGLYMLNASFVGTPNENPVGNFSIQVGT